MTSVPLMRMIHAAARQLGLDEDDRRQMQVTVTGKASLKDMTPRELKLVSDHLRAKGAGSAARRPAAADARIRMIHVLWRKLAEAGAVKPGRRALNAFMRARFEKAWGVAPADIDQLREPLQIDDVVQALKAMGQRAGIDFDWGAHRR